MTTRKKGNLVLLCNIHILTGDPFLTLMYNNTFEVHIQHLTKSSPSWEADVMCHTYPYYVLSLHHCEVHVHAHTPHKHAGRLQANHQCDIYPGKEHLSGTVDESLTPVPA